MNNYPLITVASILTALGLVFNLLTALGVRISPELQRAIIDIFAFAAPWIVVLVGHMTTTPLSRPTDVDGEPLTRSNGDPAIKAGK
jgi:hypothetical protein